MLQSLQSSPLSSTLSPSPVKLERAATPSSDALKKRLITDPNPELPPFGGLQLGARRPAAHKRMAWNMDARGKWGFSKLFGRRHWSLASAQDGLLEGQEKDFLF
jgi:hypothetical protein